MEAKMVDCLKPSNSVELAQPQGGLVSGTMPAPLPAYQPITFLSKPLDVEDAEDDDCVVFGGVHKEEIGFQTAIQSLREAALPRAKAVTPLGLLCAAPFFSYVGKNTLLISERLGSGVFLGSVLTTLPLPPDPPRRKSGGCGSCSKCQPACPTGAFVDGG